MGGLFSHYSIKIQYQQTLSETSIPPVPLAAGWQPPDKKMVNPIKSKFIE